MLSQNVKPANEFGVKYNALHNEFDGEQRHVNNYLRARRRVHEKLEPVWPPKTNMFRLEERAIIIDKRK